MDVGAMKNQEGLQSTVVIIDPVGKKAGLDHYNDSLSRALKAKGLDVKIWSNYKSQFSEAVFKFRFGKSFFDLLSLVNSLFRIFKLLKEVKPQVVVLHIFKINRSTISLSREIKKQQRKLVYILHDLESLIGEQFNDDDMKTGLDLSDEIVVHNQFTYDELVNKFPLAGAKVTIIPHGNFLDLPSAITRGEAIQSLHLEGSMKNVLFFGMIKPSKGLDVLLKAMQKLDARLIVAGRFRNSSESDYKELMLQLRSSNKLITDFDYISNEKRDLYFKAADIIVLPYHKIYQSGVLIMAMSYGLPVIASNLQPNIELAGEKKCIEFFDDGDHLQLADKINTLLADQERQNLLRKNGLELVSTANDWSAIAERFKIVLTK